MEAENKNDENLVSLAKKRFSHAQEAESEIRKLALEDVKFTAGDQWEDKMLSLRKADDRPCLTINRVPQQLRQVTNDQRQNRPAIKVSPVDSGADVETAKIIQGIVRHIEYNSSADAAYDTAFDGAVRKSFGFWRIITDYADALSFRQEIYIKRIRNAFSVYIDPHAKEADGSDMQWAFIEEKMSKDEFKASYKDAELSKSSDWFSSDDWVSDDSCRIVEYFYKEYEEKEILLLADDSVVSAEEYKDLLKQLKENPTLEIPEIKTSRKTKVPVVKWCKIAGNEILERGDWAGIHIPIVPVYGDEIDVNGKIIRESLIRHAKDSQRMYNLWASAEAEAISLAPKAPFLATPEQIKGFEDQWAKANRANLSVLPFNAHSVNGQLMPAPQRNFGEPNVQAISNARMLAAEDIKATTGIYDAALGAQSNEVSGVAIMGRQQQAQTSNFHFIDNLTRALKHTGRILVDLIPKIYDTEQVVRIIGEDGEHKTVTINAPYEENGKSYLYDLSTGRYDVVVDSGPSYATKRQEALASMLDLSKAYPNLVAVAGDLLVKNMDWEQSQEIAERIKKTIDPAILGDENAQQLPPEAQAQIQQMQQTIQILSANLQDAQQKIMNKALEIQSKEKIEAAKIDADLTKAAAKLDAEHAMLLLSKQMDEIQGWQSQVNQYLHFLVQQNANQALQQSEQGMQQNFNPTDGQSSGQIME